MPTWLKWTIGAAVAVVAVVAAVVFLPEEIIAGAAVAATTLVSKASQAISRASQYISSVVSRGADKANNNIVYRAINQKDAERLGKGLGLEAKNPSGAWNLKEHLVSGSSRASWVNDPYISTTTNIDVARGFNQSGSNLGIIKIDLSKVSSQVMRGYEIFPRQNGVGGLPYHYSIWQQEVSVYQSIPIEAIKGFVK